MSTCAPNASTRVGAVRGDRVGDEGDLGGDLLDEHGEDAGGDLARGWGEPVGRRWAVEADQGVEVHGAADLVLGDLGVLQAGDVAQVVQVGPEQLRQPALEGDGEAAPQLGRPPLPEHVRLVVVAVRAQRLPECRVVGSVHLEAGRGPPVLAACR